MMRLRFITARFERRRAERERIEQLRREAELARRQLRDQERRKAGRAYFVAVILATGILGGLFRLMPKPRAPETVEYHTPLAVTAPLVVTAGPAEPPPPEPAPKSEPGCTIVLVRTYRRKDGTPVHVHKRRCPHHHRGINNG